jgi:hypothetical protein
VSTEYDTSAAKIPDAWKDVFLAAPPGPPLSPEQLKDVERFERARGLGARPYSLDEADSLLRSRHK